MGTTASSAAVSPVDELNYTLDDLKTATAFDLKHRKIYDEFFKERWYEDETKLKAVLFIMEYIYYNDIINENFDKHKVIFAFDDEKRKDFFPTTEFIPDENRRFLILKYIKNVVFEVITDFNIEFFKEFIKLIKDEILFNSVCKPFFLDVNKIILLIKMFYVFSVLSDYTSFKIDEQFKLSIDSETDRIFFDYIVDLSPEIKEKIINNIHRFLQDFKIENILS